MKLKFKNKIANYVEFQGSKVYFFFANRIGWRIVVIQIDVGRHPFALFLSLPSNKSLNERKREIIFQMTHKSICDVSESGGDGIVFTDSIQDCLGAILLCQTKKKESEFGVGQKLFVKN